MNKIHPQAQPFYLQGNNDTVLLFIHGITASPSEVYPTARLVHEKAQCSVKGILLPGHGTTLADLSKTRWTDWYKTVDIEITKLKKQYSRIFIAGLSMGGLLSLYAGIRRTDIKGLISINTPIFIKIPAVDILAPIVRLVCRNIPKANNHWNKELNNQGRFNYNATPIDAFQSMWQLRHKVVEGLNMITVPLLVMQSALDETVRSDSGRFIASRAVKAPVDYLELTLSRHVATMDQEKGLIAGKIAEFIEQTYNM